MVSWLSQNYRTANPAREPPVIWPRHLFSLSPSHRAPRAFFFFLPSLPATQRGLCGGDPWSHFIIVGFIYECCRYYLCNLFIIRECRSITRANASMQISARKFAVLRFEGYMLCCLQSRNTVFQWQRVDKISARKRGFKKVLRRISYGAGRGLLCKMPARPYWFLSARPNYAQLFLECIMFTLKRSLETAFFAMSTLVFIFFM